MYWTSVLPVTIFMLANTLCVSESAATGSRQWVQTEAIGGNGVKRVGSSSVSLQPDFSPRTYASSSSVEAPVSEWINSQSSSTKNDMVDPGDDDNTEEDVDNDGIVDDNEEWEDVPSPTVGRLQFRYADSYEPNNPLALQSPLFYRDRLVLSSPPKVVEIPQNLNAIDRAAGRLFHYNPVGVGVVKRLRPVISQMKNQVVASQLPTQQVIWSPAKSNYRVPAEGFIRANGFDKRSPRCIAKCMQQGMVHPLQCHSLC